MHMTADLRLRPPATRPVERLVEYRKAHYAARSEAASYLTNTPAQVSFCFPNPIICQLVSGHKVMRLDGGPAFGFGVGQAMFVPPGMTIDIDLSSASADAPIECDCLEIEADHMDTLLARLNDRLARTGHGLSTGFALPEAVCMSPEDSRALDLPGVMALFRGQRDVFSDLKIDMRIEQLILTLCQQHGREVQVQHPDADDSGLAEAVRRITANLDRQVPIEELVAVARMSESTLHRQFRRQFGTTPAGFARGLRLREASKALRDTQERIEQLAFRLGFADASHFSREFRKTTGESPAEYRKRFAPSGVRLDWQLRSSR